MPLDPHVRRVACQVRRGGLAIWPSITPPSHSPTASSPPPSGMPSAIIGLRVYLGYPPLSSSPAPTVLPASVQKSRQGLHPGG